MDSHRLVDRLASRLLVDSPLVEERVVGAISVEDVEEENQHSSVVFIIWYICLVIFCIVPSLVVGLSCLVIRCRRQDEEDRLLANREVQEEIARIEANIQAYSSLQEKRRKEQLWHSLESSCVTLGPEHFNRFRADSNESDDIEQQVETKNGKEEMIGFEAQISQGCTICLNKYVVGDEVICSGSCGHAFHRDCLLHWFATRIHGEQLTSTIALARCPCCRQSFVAERLPTMPPPPTFRHASTTTTVIASEEDEESSESSDREASDSPENIWTELGTASSPDNVEDSLSSSPA